MAGKLIWIMFFLITGIYAWEPKDLSSLLKQSETAVSQIKKNTKQINNQINSALNGIIVNNSNVKTVKNFSNSLKVLKNKSGMLANNIKNEIKEADKLQKNIGSGKIFNSVFANIYKQKEKKILNNINQLKNIQNVFNAAKKFNFSTILNKTSYKDAVHIYNDDIHLQARESSVSAEEKYINDIFELLKYRFIEMDDTVFQLKKIKQISGY